MIRDYRLLKPHKHNKVLQPMGATLKLPEQLGEWLIEQGIAESTTPRAALVHGPHAIAPRQQAALLQPAPRTKRGCCW